MAPLVSELGQGTRPGCRSTVKCVGAGGGLGPVGDASVEVAPELGAGVTAGVSAGVGLYSSTEARTPLSFIPPATRTRPSESSVAVPPSRAATIGSVALKAPVFGSYSSAEATALKPASRPPATRTRPSERSVAVPPSRAAVIEPVKLQAPLTGSYSSAEARTAEPS